MKPEETLSRQLQENENLKLDLSKLESEKKLALLPNAGLETDLKQSKELLEQSNGKLGKLKAEKYVMAGFCSLPDGKMSSCHSTTSYRTQEAALPPGFDLHRFITHVNLGITHFHGSFWPLPRGLSDTALEAAEPPKEWLHYMLVHYDGFVFVGPDRQGFGVEKRDGARVPLYRYYVHIWIGPRTRIPLHVGQDRYNRVQKFARRSKAQSVHGCGSCVRTNIGFINLS
ncbi:hypothetical protein B0H14DRAFT_3130281 [Mycena olivaceomarginata]|nr:hypothetical protein B0H14DRAFT_3130281 [Mycena olivaceomarginata]